MNQRNNNFLCSHLLDTIFPNIGRWSHFSFSMSTPGHHPAISTWVYDISFSISGFMLLFVWVQYFSSVAGCCTFSWFMIKKQHVKKKQNTYSNPEKRHIPSRLILIACVLACFLISVLLIFYEVKGHWISKFDPKKVKYWFFHMRLIMWDVT